MNELNSKGFERKENKGSVILSFMNNQVDVSSIISGLRPKEEKKKASSRFFPMDGPKVDWIIKILPKKWSSEKKENPIGYAFSNFKHEIVVDLGAGEMIDAYTLCAAGGAKAYVAVDLPETIEMKISVLEQMVKKGVDLYTDELNEHGIDVPKIPTSIEKTDMLSFLRRLPNNSVSIFMSGIDEYVIPNPDYRKEVLNEIERVLSTSGALVQWATYELNPHNLKKEIISPLRNPYSDAQLVVYKKDKH